MNYLIRKFEACLTAKDTSDKLRIGVDQTSTTRLGTFHLKWILYEMDSTRTIVEHLQNMSVIVHDLKVVGREISEEKQVLNVIRMLPD